jgi:hypothetical protein
MDPFPDVPIRVRIPVEALIRCRESNLSWRFDRFFEAKLAALVD